MRRKAVRRGKPRVPVEAGRGREFRFVDFEKYLDDYIAKLPEKKPRQVREDYKWFRQYYFDSNDDP